MTRMTVNVTRPLIDRATQRDSRHCMIAEAIQADHEHFRNVSVDLATIRWTNPRTGKRYVALTPEPAAAALVAFDQGEAVEPFAFPMETIQVTASRKAIETMAEAQAAGRKRPRTAPRGVRSLTVGEDGRARIAGGETIPRGHLGGSAAVKAANHAARREATARLEQAEATDADLFPAPVPEAASNVRRSQARYRQYGRRVLKP